MDYFNSDPMTLHVEIAEEDQKKLMDLLYKPLPKEIMQKIKDIYNYMAQTNTTKFMAMPSEDYQFVIEIRNVKDKKAEEAWHAGKWRTEEEPKFRV